MTARVLDNLTALSALAQTVPMLLKRLGRLIDGSVSALAVTNDVRNPQMPELPTMIEAGVSDFISASLTGIVAPPEEFGAYLTHERQKWREVWGAVTKAGKTPPK